MKSGLWIVSLWPDSKAIAGASLDRLISDAAGTVADGGVLRAVCIVSLHSSAAAADKAARLIAEKLKASGWWLADGCAENEERNQEGMGDEF